MASEHLAVPGVESLRGLAPVVSVPPHVPHQQGTGTPMLSVLPLNHPHPTPIIDPILRYGRQ